VSTRAPYPLTNGHNQRTFNILSQVAVFADIAFFGFYDKGTSIGGKTTVRQKLKEICSHTHLEEVPDETSSIKTAKGLMLALNDKRPYVARKYLSETMREAIQQFVGHTSVDIVHLDMLPLAEYLPILSDFPILLTTHNVESTRLKLWSEAERNPARRLYLRWQYQKMKEYEARILQQLHYCVVVSEEDRSYFQQLNPECRIFIVPNGTDTRWFSPQPRQGRQRPTILWVGNMIDPYNRSGVRFFTERVFRSIVAAVPNVRWLIVGKGAPKSLGKLCREYPGSIEIAGFVDDVRPFYDTANVVIVPLVSGAGTKLKVIEALAMGKSIVTTTVGAEGLSVSHGENIYIADDAAAFADHVVEALSDSDLQSAIGKQARMLAIGKYDWRTIGKAQIKAYEAATPGAFTECVE